MANVKATWSLPTVNSSQRPIAKVTVELSADNGANYRPVADVLPADAQEISLSDVDPGNTYVFRLTVVDVIGAKGQPVLKGFSVPSQAPGVVTNLVVTIS